MSDNDGKKTLGVRGGGPRSGSVKQSFSHGRTKNVVVETKRKRVVVPKPGAGGGSKGGSAPGGSGGKRPAGISDAEMERRLKALQAAKAREADEQAKREAEEKARAEERERLRAEKEQKEREQREAEERAKAKAEEEARKAKEAAEAAKKAEAEAAKAEAAKKKAEAAAAKKAEAAARKAEAAAKKAEAAHAEPPELRFPDSACANEFAISDGPLEVGALYAAPWSLDGELSWYVGEVTRLVRPHWCDVNFDDGKLMMRAKLSERDVTWHVVCKKRGRTGRARGL